jgi:riboflavin transporter FmnP
MLTPHGVTLDTKAIALTIVFAALAIVLTPVAIPAGFLLGYFYRFWEIPIVVAFLLLGPKIGITVAVIRTIAELTLFLGPAGFLGPITAFGGTMSMLLGV